MILIFLELHTKQLGRLLKELGLVRSLIVLALLAFTLARTYTLEPPLTYALVALLVFLLTSLHTFRKDRAFLKILGVQSYRLYAVEYHLLATPFYIELLLNGRWVELMAVLATVSFIPLLSVSIQRKANTARGLAALPPEAFEWKSGLRRHGMLIGLLYLLALMCYSYPFVALLVIVVFTFIVTTFYNESEPRAMVEAFGGSPATFLLGKWRVQLTLFWLGCAPLLLLFLLANSAYWYVLLVWVIVSSIIQVLSINLKYGLYEPGLTLNKDLFMFIYSLSLFVPYFVPVPFVMLCYYYRRASKNLQTYLDASH